MAKERDQNPTCGDTVNLRLFVYNANNRRDVKEIQKVDIYVLDPAERTVENPDGRRLVQTIAGTEVTTTDTGSYLLAVELADPLYTIGTYLDVWSVVFEDSACGIAAVANAFSVLPDLWFTTPTPPVYDFQLTFSPNKITKGSKRYLIVRITPNVPKGSDLERYYENLAIISDIRVSIAMSCGTCLPAEEDLRLIVDRVLIDHREKQVGYYFLDTTDLDEGIYDVWFEVIYGESTYISDRNQLQIYI